LYLFFVAQLVAADPIRVATLNTKNYLISDRSVNGKWRPDYPKPEVEKAALRKAILKVDADVLILQEMGTKPFLLELKEDLKVEGIEYDFAIHMDGLDENRHLAVLSKVAPIDVVEHTDLDFKYFEERLQVKRGMLEVTFPLGQFEQAMTVYAVHLKSRWSDVEEDPESNLRRTREAEACRNRIVERLNLLAPEAQFFLVAGDFNDHPASAPLRRFYSKGDFLISERILAHDSRGEQWTHFYEKHLAYTTVDGFLISPSFAQYLASAKGYIFDSPVGSDHRMVYVDLKLPEKP